MAKFYITTAPYYNGGTQIALNLDNVTVVIKEDGCCLVRMVDGNCITISDEYESFIKDVRPFVPFEEMCNKAETSEWIRKYLNETKGDELVNNNHG